MGTPSIKKNFIYSTFYQILTMITPLITAPYISRILGVDGIGIYSYTSSIVVYFAMFAALGVASYGNREIAQHRDNRYECSKLFYEIQIMCVFTTIVSILMWGSVIFISSEYRKYFAILTLQLISVAFDNSWFFGGLEEYSYIVKKNTLFKLFGIVLLFILVQKKDDLGVYILILTGTTLLGNISMWTYLPKFLCRVDVKELNVKRHFRETVIYFIPTIATSVYTVLDKTLIGIITKNEFENGYYEQATKIINMAKAVTFTALNTVMGSRIAYLFSKNSFREIREKIDLSINYIIFIGVAISFGIVGIAQKFVPWFFGEGYEPVVKLLVMLSPIIVIIGISNCIGSMYYTPAGFRVKSTKYIIFGSVTNLFFNILLIPQLGSRGAIIGSLLAESLITVLYVRNSSGYVTARMILEHIWKRVIAGAIMLGIIYEIGIRCDASVLTTTIQVICGALAYILILCVMKDELIKLLYCKIIEIKNIKNK